MKLIRKILNIFILLFFTVPMAVLLLWSFTAGWPFENLLPQKLSLQGYEYLISSKDYLILIATFVFSAFAGFLSVLGALMASSALIRMQSRLVGFLEGLFYMPMLVPVLSICLGLHKFFLKLPINSFFAVLLIHLFFSFPYAFKILYSAYKVQGYKFIYSARNLGVGDFQIFLHIEIPLLKEYSTTAFIFAFAVSYGQYFINYFFGKGSISFSMVMYPFLEASNRNIASAYAVVFIITGIIIVLILEKGEKLFWKVSGSKRYPLN